MESPTATCNMAVLTESYRLRSGKHSTQVTSATHDQFKKKKKKNIVAYCFFFLNYICVSPETTLQHKVIQQQTNTTLVFA